MAAATNKIPSRPLTWLITGTSSGFGLTLARYVQAAGHTLIASSRNPAKTPNLVSEIEAKGGKWIALDVTDPESGKVIDNLEASGTQIDVLVNNAGFSIFSSIETGTEKEVRDQMDVLYFGPLRLTRALLPYWRKRRFGTLVNISSGGSLDGSPAMGYYGGAKAALDGATRVLNKEVAAFNIRTLTVIIGTFNTSFAANVILGEKPLPEDYKGGVVDNFIGYLKDGKIPINGDKDKGMQILYEVVTGTGIGADKEAEKVLLLGPDMIARAQGTVDTWTHALDVFGAAAKSCAMDK